MNFLLLIPNFDEILGFLAFLIFFAVNINIGHLISGEKSSGTNFAVGFSINYFFLLIAHIFLSQIKLLYFYYGYLFISFIFLAFFHKKVINHLYYFIDFLKVHKIFLIVISVLFLIIFNSKAIGWDSFTHWMPLAEKLLDPITEVTGHAKYYPIASAIIPLTSSLFVQKLVENTYAIYNFFLLVILHNSYSQELIHFKSKNFLKLTKLGLIFYVFYNPGIVNKFTFTSYPDFSLGIFLFFLVKNLFNKNSNYPNFVILSLISILIVGTKNTGLILVFFSIFSFIFSSYVFENKDLKTFLLKYKNYFIPLVCAIFSFFLWKYFINQSGNYDRIIRYEGSFFKRIEVINLFAKSAIMQILDRKVFFFPIFLLSLVVIYFKDFLQKDTKTLVLACLVLFILWNCFLIFMYFVWFSIGETSGANSYWRYNMILGPINSYVFLKVLIDFINYYRKSVNINFDKMIIVPIILFLILFPIIFVEKIRRDIYYPNIPSSFFSSKKNEYKNVLYIGPEGPYQSVRISYYLSKNMKDYQPRVKDIYNLQIEMNSEIVNNIYLKNKHNNKYDAFIKNYKSSSDQWIFEFIKKI